MGIDSNTIADFASLFAAFAALILAVIALWQCRQTQKALNLNLAKSRPILTLDIAVEKLPSDLSRVQFVVKNSGPIPARLIHKATQLWIDGETRNPTDHTDVDIVLPDEDHIISSFDLTGDFPKYVINGEVELKYAIAILYGPTTTDDPRRWITDAWIAFSPRKRAFALRKRDEAEAGSNTNRCDLQKLQPDDWLTWQSPSFAR